MQVLHILSFFARACDINANKLMYSNKGTRILKATNVYAVSVPL